MSERLKALSDAGVSIWLDDLSRERLETGNLADLVKNSHVVGVTTNPSIFAAALADGERYDAQVRELAASGADVDTTVFALTTTDVRDACDVMKESFEASNGVDGRVSIEVAPDLAHDEDATIGLRAGALRRGRPAQRADQDPRDHRGRPGDHHHDRRGHQRQRHADLRPGALPGRHGGLRQGPRAGPRQRPGPVEDPLGRLVLRLPRGHRDRQAARGHRRPRRPARQGRGRQRAAGLPRLRGVLQR